MTRFGRHYGPGDTLPDYRLDPPDEDRVSWDEDLQAYVDEDGEPFDPDAAEEAYWDRKIEEAEDARAWGDEW